MANQIRFVRELGTAVVLGESGASGVTVALALDALGSGSARMSAAFDLGSQWDQEHIVEPAIESGTAPTAGAAIDVYAAYSMDNTNWPAGVSGSEGAWPADGNEDEWAKQLSRPIVSVISTNDANTVQRQNATYFRPKSRYMVVVVDNNWDQSVRDQATATDNLSRIKITPAKDYGIDP